MPPACFLLLKVADWVEPLNLTLSQDGPLEIKVTETARMVDLIFWGQADIVGKRKISVGDLLEYSYLPCGKYLFLPLSEA